MKDKTKYYDFRKQEYAKNPSGRMCFASDESGHVYCIPVELKEEFSEWAEGDENWDRFNEYRLNMHYTNYSFENVEEIK